MDVTGPMKDPRVPLEMRAILLHHHWMQSCVDKGWSYGATFCEVRKTDPRFVPWVSLSFNDRVEVYSTLVTLDPVGILN